MPGENKTFEMGVVPPSIQGNSDAMEVHRELVALQHPERLERFYGLVAVTPLIDGPTRFPGYDFKIKYEGEQPGGAYKLRGAYNAMLAAEARGEQFDTVAFASTGNHGIETAIAAKWHGVAKVIGECASDIPEPKKDSIEALGVQLNASHSNLDEAFIAAKARGDKRGTLFIHAYDNSSVIAAQGTISLEAVDQLEEQGYDLDDPNTEVTFVYAGGGGGKAAGNVVALATRYPKARIIVSQMQGGDGIAMKLRGEHIDPKKFSYECRGAAVPTPGNIAMSIIGDPRHNVSVMTPTMGDVGAAMELLSHYHKKPESAGALAMAAAYLYAEQHPVNPEDGKRRVIVPVTSGINLAPDEEAEFNAAFRKQQREEARQKAEIFAAQSRAYMSYQTLVRDLSRDSRDGSAKSSTPRRSNYTVGGHW